MSTRSTSIFTYNYYYEVFDVTAILFYYAIVGVRYVRYEPISGRNPRLLINAFVTETGNLHNCSYDLCYNIKIVPPDFYFLIAFFHWWSECFFHNIGLYFFSNVISYQTSGTFLQEKSSNIDYAIRSRSSLIILIILLCSVSI